MAMAIVIAPSKEEALDYEDLLNAGTVLRRAALEVAVRPPLPLVSHRPEPHAVRVM